MRVSQMSRDRSTARSGRSLLSPREGLRRSSIFKILGRSWVKILRIGSWVTWIDSGRKSWDLDLLWRRRIEHKKRGEKVSSNNRENAKGSRLDAWYEGKSAWVSGKDEKVRGAKKNYSACLFQG